MLSIKNVEKHYKQFSLDCSLKVNEGNITGLIGKNGAGKTTLFKMILGLTAPDGGEIEIFGKPQASLDLHDRQQIGVVLSDSGFNGYLTINDYLPVLGSLYENFRKEEFVHRCSRFRLPMDQKIRQFSTGMKRKLQLTAAICHEARLLLLDEPTAGMDAVARDEMLELLRLYMEPGDRSILISSHISTDLENLCDDLYLIDDGRIALHEDTDVLTDEYGILKMTKEQYDSLDQTYIMRHKKENFGYSCLTSQRQFYQENYPEIQIEKGSIDGVMLMMIQGEAEKW